MNRRRKGAKQISLQERVAALKQRLRDEDERALREGRMTAEEINRKNSAFGPGFAAKVKLDFDKIGRIR